MYISRASVDPQRLRYDEIARMRLDNPYETHRTLWKLFDSEMHGGRPFLFRSESQGPLGRFILVSEQAPNTTGPWYLQTKPYMPRLLAGEHLGFQVTVNPVVTRKDAQGRHQRHDVVMDLKKRLNWQGQEAAARLSEAELEHQAGCHWLMQRCQDKGFAIDPLQVRADAYRQYRIPKKNEKPLRFSTLDLTGLLTVTDPDRFRQTLFHGLGPAKGFGCGLLLVRRLGAQ